MARTTGSVGEDTARKVRSVAQRLFAQHGYAAVSMRQIAGEVGFQAGALYNHFPTKQAILVDLMRDHMHLLLLAWEAESKKFSEPLSALEGFVRFHIRYHFDKQDAVFISYMELRNLEEPGLSEIQKLRKYYEGFLRKIITVGNDSKIFSIQDVPVSTMAIISMLTGVNAWYNDNGRLSADEVEDIYVAMVLGAVGAITSQSVSGPAIKLEPA